MIFVAIFAYFFSKVVQFLLISRLYNLFLDPKDALIGAFRGTNFLRIFMQKTIVKGNPLNFNVGIQRWYIKELLKLVDKLTDSVLKEISPLFREYKDQITFSQDASIQSQPSISSQARIRLNALRKEYIQI